MNRSALSVTGWLMAAVSSAAAQGPPLDYAGFTHTPLGGATLLVNPDGHLEVNNIGSSGLDACFATLLVPRLLLVPGAG